MNRNFYQNARKRCMPMGTNIVTDADIILMQEEEIERYREKIRNLENDNRSLIDEIRRLNDARTNYAEFEIPFIMYKGKKYRATTFCIHEDEVGQYIELKGIKLVE